jgi:hypothetical protein
MCKYNSRLYRFIESMNIDYEKWHDGVGYDLEALKSANNKEREAIERILVNRNPPDWRDIEALAILNTPRARSAIKVAVLSGIHEVNMAVLRYAPELVNDELKTKLIVEALKFASFYYGLSQTLDIVEKYHPKEVVRELFHGLLNREGEVAVHFAAMLFYIYGKAETSFDWEKRAFFLKFNTIKLSDRKILFQELCNKLNVDYREYLKCNQI